MRLLAFIFILLSPAVLAQGEEQPGNLVRIWQSEDGLPGNVVRSIVQCSEGYLWVATAEGIARFDGFEFKLIEPEGPLRRTRFAFWRLFATSGGYVWVATYQGGLFRVRDGKLVSILDNDTNTRPAVVTQLIEDAGGTVFFKQGDRIGRIAGNGVEMIGAPDGVLMELFEKDRRSQLEHGRAAPAGGVPLLRDREGRVWTSNASGRLSVGDGDHPGIPVEVPDRAQLYSVNELFEDREGNIWVATPITGLVRIRQARVDVLNDIASPFERAVFALMEDRSGTWWIANRGGGVTRRTAAESRTIGLNRPAAAFFEDKESRMWVASRDGSVFLYQNGGFQQQFSKTQSPSKVLSITQDVSGVLWFGGMQGLASFDGGEVRLFGLADGMDQSDVTVLQPFDGGKKIIVGTSGGKILLGGNQGFSVVGKPETLGHQWISGILPISATETWVSTLGGGLFLWDGKKWHRFHTGEGLPDSRLTCVLDDGRGYLWFGSLGGIIRAKRSELLGSIRDPATWIHWLRLDRSDGLPSRECIGGFQPAGWKAGDGRLWFATGSGVVNLRPDLMELNKVAPPVYLQSARVDGVPQEKISASITSGPGRSRLEFRFVGLSFSAPEKVTYRARLAGLEDSWRELGTQRVAAFEAVPPGGYTFEVMAVNGDGLRSEVPARMAVKIRPHFWQTGWFLVSTGAAVLLAAAGSGWAGARLKMRRRIQLLKIRNARESERSRIARDLHDDLGASLTEISILAALAAEDAAESPFHPSLDQLSAKAKNVVGTLDEIVWAVNPREDTVRSLVDYLAAFAREFLDIARIPLRIDVARDIPELPLATSGRHGVFLAARETLNNIVKHSEATEVLLRVTFTETLLEIIINDNGRGFEPDYSRGGNGLGNIEERMREAGGSARIETFRAQGTTISLSLPMLAQP